MILSLCQYLNDLCYTKVKTLIESVGCSILFLPTYSPDLNLFWVYSPPLAA
ncbi:hypothetical protein [Rickettsia endosymbiont of Gonocerus acuteangulatus]|uniref:hypothetical protein n=1 Tax=Rickettsia endosymbiont of Gonocerus acuteangulatus TaxID=3066266 RepID=UPI0031329F9A